MTDFQAGDPGASGTPAGPTNFQQGGGAGTQNSDPADTTVVLEYGGRQFTKADLLKKLANADGHITTLTTELADQRKLLTEVNDTLRKQVTAAELLQQIKEGKAPVAAPAAPAAAPAATEVPDANAIAAQVLGKLKESRDAEQREANWTEVTTALTQRYGDKVNQKVSEVAAEAGLTLVEAAELARSKPKAFLRLFPDAPKAQGSALPSAGRHNTQSFQAQSKGPSGFTTAKNTREQVDIYLNRLRELGL